MANGYELQAGELDSHAGHLDGFADQLRTALDAATSVSLPTDAYGIICQFFPPLLTPIQTIGLDAIGKAVDAMADDAQGIRDNAGEYRAQEEHHAATFGRGMAR